jgi:16S rRNA (cytosine1402-N4)-methyltransferase
MPHVSRKLEPQGAGATGGARRKPLVGKHFELAQDRGRGFLSRARPRMTSDSPHAPVLAAEAVGALAIVPDGLYLDGTFGAGGYTRLILSSGGRVLALDRDPSAISGGAGLVEESAGRLSLAQARFSRMEQAARERGLGPFDGIVLDIGVSSMQLDQPERGFSFRFDGPLDMRMEKSGRSAADLVNALEEGELADLLYLYGEERASRRIARAIATERLRAPITTTGALAQIIARANPGKWGDIHPATRSFQALRIAVNEELDELTQALSAAERLLRPGGRLAVVTFHSLEDRIVKKFFAERSGRGRAPSRLLPGEIAPPPPTFSLRGPQPVAPGEAECARNPRARSAKLRWAERLKTPSPLAGEGGPKGRMRGEGC